jgi:hypothetical protein
MFNDMVCSPGNFQGVQGGHKGNQGVEEPVPYYTAVHLELLQEMMNKISTL